MRLHFGMLGAVRRQILLTLQLLRGLEPLVSFCFQEERLTSEMEGTDLQHHFSLRSSCA